MIQSFLLSYINLTRDFETDGFKLSPYEPCVSNNSIEGEPLLSVFHLDNVKLSHKDTNVVDNFKKCIEFMYKIQTLENLNQ